MERFLVGKLFHTAGESEFAPGAWVQAQQVPWTNGLKKAEILGTIKLGHELAKALEQAHLGCAAESKAARDAA
jgi:hypothetical protein